LFSYSFDQQIHSTFDSQYSLLLFKNNKGKQTIKKRIVGGSSSRIILAHRDNLSFEAKENSGENISLFIITQVVVENHPVATFAIIIIYRVDKETNVS